MVQKYSFIKEIKMSITWITAMRNKVPAHLRVLLKSLGEKDFIFSEEEILK